MQINMNEPIETLYLSKSRNRGCWHKGRQLDYHVLLYILEGSAKIEIASRVEEVMKGDILIIPRNTFYKPLGGDILVHRICFHACCNAGKEGNSQIEVTPIPTIGVYKYGFFTENPTIHVKELTHCSANTEVKDILKKLTMINIWQNNNNKILLDIYLKELLFIISTESSSLNLINPRLRRIMQYIDDNYTQDITLPDLSQKFYLSVSYIARLFKDELGITTVDYINKVRTSIACNLLLNTQMSIEEISEQVGFRYPNYFTRVFKKIYKTTPGKFRHGWPCD